jgi:hypothetical protein
MKQEYRELLIKDLCTRLPYEVKVQVFNCGVESVETLYQIDLDGYISTIESDDLKYSFKPYLLPLSSMTEEQMEEYNDLNCYELGCFPHLQEALDYLIENHFDYRYLIDRGLAIDATNLNIY